MLPLTTHLFWPLSIASKLPQCSLAARTSNPGKSLLISLFFFFFFGSFTQRLLQVVFQRWAQKKPSSSNNAGKMAKGCLLKQMQESKFQSWRVMDISQWKITQSNTTACWAFLRNTAQSKCNNNQGRYFRNGVYDLQSCCSFIFAVLFPLQTECEIYWMNVKSMSAKKKWHIIVYNAKLNWGTFIIT